MNNFYTYLISSLPLLNFQAQPPFSFETFLNKCYDLIPQEDFDILKGLKDQRGEYKVVFAIEKWLGFDAQLRNELVKLRASRKKIDPHKYLRTYGYSGPSLYHIVLAAARSPSVLEGERLLDEARWKFLDELTMGHYFDLHFLIVYAYKLLILERWGKINAADKEQLLKETLNVNINEVLK